MPANCRYLQAIASSRVEAVSFVTPRVAGQTDVIDQNHRRSGGSSRLSTGLLATGQTLRVRVPAPMKPSALRIERLLAKVEADLVPPPRRWLRVIIDGDGEAGAMEEKEKALAEHIAAHPEDSGRTVEDFNWILRVIVRPAGMAIIKG